MPLACALASASQACKRYSTANLGASAPCSLHELVEVLAVEVLHDDERSPVGQVTDVEDPGDVLALDPGRSARLTGEARDDLLVDERLGRKNLSATASPRSRWVAETTKPMPPAPKRPVIPYLPAMTSPSSKGIENGASA